MYRYPLIFASAPRWKRGYIVEIFFVTGTWLTFMIGIYLHRRDIKRAEAARITVDEEKLGEEVAQVERRS